MLTERKGVILKILIEEYVATASPVGSGSIARRSGLGVSPATVRNEMAELDEEGYITRPHTSAGGVPTDKGYRYYVEALGHPVPPPGEVQEEVRQRFLEADRDLELWTRLAAAILAQLIHNLALVTFPRAGEARLRHLELVYVQEFLTLLVLVLQEARLHQQLLPLTEPVTPEQLTVVTNRLNASYRGRTRREMKALGLELSPLESQVLEAALRIMDAEERKAVGEHCVDGLRHLLGQPELKESARARSLVEALEDQRLAQALLASLSDGPVTVTIGQEHEDEALHPFSAVLCPYGVAGELLGTVAAIGPTRMPYDTTIGTAQYVSSVMTNLITGMYGRS